MTTISSMAISSSVCQQRACDARPLPASSHLPPPTSHPPSSHPGWSVPSASPLHDPLDARDGQVGHRLKVGCIDAGGAQAGGMHADSGCNGRAMSPAVGETHPAPWACRGRGCAASPAPTSHPAPLGCPWRQGCRPCPGAAHAGQGAFKVTIRRASGDSSRTRPAPGVPTCTAADT